MKPNTTNKLFADFSSRQTDLLVNATFVFPVRFKDCMDDKKATLLQLEHDDDDATGVICNGLKVSNDSSGDTAILEELPIIADEQTD
jgi:hypothetical protein